METVTVMGCVVPGVLNIAFVKTAEEYDAVEIEMQSDILFVLSCLCDGDMHRKVGRILGHG